MTEAGEVDGRHARRIVVVNASRPSAHCDLERRRGRLVTYTVFSWPLDTGGDSIASRVDGARVSSAVACVTVRPFCRGSPSEMRASRGWKSARTPMAATSASASGSAVLGRRFRALDRCRAAGIRTQPRRDRLRAECGQSGRRFRSPALWAVPPPRSETSAMSSLRDRRSSCRRGTDPWHGGPPISDRSPAERPPALILLATPPMSARNISTLLRCGFAVSGCRSPAP